MTKPTSERFMQRQGLLPTCPEHAPMRRQILRMSLALGATALAPGMRSVFAQDSAVQTTRTMPTPDQILGPFYPVRHPEDADADLTHQAGKGAALGQIVYVMGRVLNLRGEPVAGAQLEVWQANAAGRYTHPSDPNPAPIDPNFDGYALIRTDAEGRYRFKTVKPGAYTVARDWTRPPHIHFDVRGHLNRLVTQMYFAGEPLNDKDRLLQSSWAKDSLVAKMLPPTKDEEAEAQLAVWDVVLIQG